MDGEGEGDRGDSELSCIAIGLVSRGPKRRGVRARAHEGVEPNYQTEEDDADDSEQSTKHTRRNGGNGALADRLGCSGRPPERDR